MCKRFLSFFATFILTAMLFACGGGGGGGGGGSTTPSTGSTVTRLSGSPIPIQSTSYLNFKNVGLAQQTIPNSVKWDNARAWGDFSRSGNLDLFTATLTYDLTKPASQATASKFQFWKVMSDGSYVLDSTKLVSNNGCIHPRKALVNDFNGDSIPDIFVICHGYDGGTYPGEKNQVVLSQANGAYLIQEASTSVAFWHGGAALDVNGDGYKDVIAVSGGNSISTFLNNGNGQFSLEAAGRFPILSSGGYYSIEAIDVNKDGYQDILVGGHEMDGARTLVITNPGTNMFASANQTTVPSVINQGVVLDFVLTGSGSSANLWVLRTGSTSSTFYVGKSVQKVIVSTNSSSIALQVDSGNWASWIIPSTRSGRNFVSSDLLSDSIDIAY